jgi:hypothetical protein
MLATSIRDKHFKDYPPEARQIATNHIELLRKLPTAFTPLLLQQIQAYDWRFPAERRDIDQQLKFLQSLSDVDRGRLLGGFERLELPASLTNSNWLSSPGEFSEQLSGYLWSSNQIDAFREASSNYLKAFGSAVPNQPLAAPRLGIAVIGKGVERNSYPLFRRFRASGTYFKNVNPANGLEILLSRLEARAAAHPSPFDHWYIDGGAAERVTGSFIATISYDGLEPNRRALLRKIDKEIQAGIAGPEALLSSLHKLRPEEIALNRTSQHTAVLSHFEISLLTAGSGTQIFSTSFVQWATHELWRRAQPLTMLARFAPRQRQRPMNELLSGEPQNPELDSPGSLIDADMGAFYMWLDQQRLSGAREASFLVWFENHNEAFIVSPALPRNTESNSPVDMHQLLAQID